VVDGLAEVALATRFLFVAVGPPEQSSIVELTELGRAFATLLNDRVRAGPYSSNSTGPFAA